MSTTGDEIVTYLASELTLTEGTTIVKNKAPATPDAVLVVYESGGSASELGFGTAGVLYEFPTIQIVCRGARDDTATPRAQAELAYRALAEIQAEELSGTQYHIVRPLNPPSVVLGPDENGRPRVSFNVAIEKELSV